MSGDGDRGTMPPLALRDKLLYTVGYFGVSLLSGLFLLWANYRYGLLFTGGRKAWVGVALLAAHLADAPLDPLIGWWSDRTRTRMGRRQPFIAGGAAPLVATFALLWAPPGAVDSAGNLVWLVAIGIGFFGLFSLVVNPYLAMLPDLARSDDDRVTTSALIATFGLAAEVLAMIGGSILAGRTSFAFAVGTVCVVALACLLLPLLVREREPAREPTTAEFGFAAALRETLANRPFQVFLVSKCLFWLGVRSAIAIVPFFVAGVLRFPERQVEVESALLVACCVGPAFGWLGLMKPLVRRFSKRRVALAGLACLGLGAGLMATVGVLPVDRVLYARLILAVSGFSLAVVFAVPNAILADLVDLDERRTGARREAMYFGSQGFFVKVSWGGASALVMAAQGAFHADPATATRVCWIAIAAVSALAFAAFLRFPEDRELRQL